MVFPLGSLTIVWLQNPSHKERGALRNCNFQRVALGSRNSSKSSSLASNYMGIVSGAGDQINPSLKFNTICLLVVHFVAVSVPRRMYAFGLWGALEWYIEGPMGSHAMQLQWSDITCRIALGSCSICIEWVFSSFFWKSPPQIKCGRKSAYLMSSPGTEGGTEVWMGR